MRNDPLPFTFVTSDGEANETSVAIPAGHYWGHVVQISGTFVADVTVQVRISNALDYADAVPTSTPAIIPLGYPVQSVRLKIENYVSGQVVAAYAGYKIR